MDQPPQSDAADRAMETGIAHHRAGRRAEAEHVYRQVLAANPNHAGATRMLGVLASQAGHHADAVGLLGRAVELTGGANPGIMLDLAVAWRSFGRPNEADAAYRAALATNPNSPEILAAYGEFLRVHARHDEAIDLLGRAAALDPQAPALLNLLGIALAERKRIDEAADCFRRAMALDPSLAQTHNNLGTALLQQNHAAEAETEFREAVELDPAYVLAQENLGASLIRQGRFEDAVPALERAIEMRPDFAQAHENLGWALIGLGQWQRGLAEWEWRLKVPGRPGPPPNAPQPRWQGEELDGRTILLYGESGPGDAVQFARYVPLVAQRGGRVLLACPGPVVRLMGGVGGGARVLRPDDLLPPFQVHCPLMSLPYVFGTTPENVPSAKAAYLAAPAAASQQWKERLASAGRKKVGLVLPGKALDPARAARAASIEALEPLSRVEGVTFFGLRDGEGGEPAPAWVTDCSPEIHDLADAAALLRNLDMVVVHDCTLAHVAGALGRPTVLMLNQVGDPRWMTGRNDTPWYGSVRLFRQKTAGVWDDVIARIARSLVEWVKR